MPAALSEYTRVPLFGAVPLNFDWGPGIGDPDLDAVSTGDTAVGTWSESPITSGVWLADPAEIGPYGAKPPPTSTASLSATADDGVILYVNGQNLIDEWVNEAATNYQASITLNAQQLYDIQKGARTDYSQMMKQTVANLSEDDILDIVAYVASLPPQPKPHAAEKTGGN